MKSLTDLQRTELVGEFVNVLDSDPKLSGDSEKYFEMLSQTHQESKVTSEDAIRHIESPLASKARGSRDGPLPSPETAPLACFDTSTESSPFSSNSSDVFYTPEMDPIDGNALCCTMSPNASTEWPLDDSSNGTRSAPLTRATEVEEALDVQMLETKSTTCHNAEISAQAVDIPGSYVNPPSLLCEVIPATPVAEATDMTEHVSDLVDVPLAAPPFSPSSGIDPNIEKCHNFLKTAETTNLSALSVNEGVAYMEATQLPPAKVTEEVIVPGSIHPVSPPKHTADRPNWALAPDDTQTISSPKKARGKGRRSFRRPCRQEFSSNSTSPALIAGAKSCNEFIATAHDGSLVLGVPVMESDNCIHSTILDSVAQGCHHLDQKRKQKAKSVKFRIPDDENHALRDSIVQHSSFQESRVDACPDLLSPRFDKSHSNFTLQPNVGRVEDNGNQIISSTELPTYVHMHTKPGLLQDSTSVFYLASPAGNSQSFSNNPISSNQPADRFDNRSSQHYSSLRSDLVHPPITKPYPYPDDEEFSEDPSQHIIYHSSTRPGSPTLGVALALDKDYARHVVAKYKASEKAHVGNEDLSTNSVIVSDRKRNLHNLGARVQMTQSCSFSPLDRLASLPKRTPDRPCKEETRSHDNAQQPLFSLGGNKNPVCALTPSIPPQIPSASESTNISHSESLRAAIQSLGPGYEDYPLDDIHFPPVEIVAAKINLPSRQFTARENHSEPQGSMTGAANRNATSHSRIPISRRSSQQSLENPAQDPTSLWKHQAPDVVQPSPFAAFVRSSEHNHLPWRQYRHEHTRTSAHQFPHEISTKDTRQPRLPQPLVAPKIPSSETTLRGCAQKNQIHTDTTSQGNSQRNNPFMGCGNGWNGR
ncbi:hypothetical protein B0H34DRAFT_671379 [Crassisporium funariophilum]|nr:hypothetical protein B0H34DRAFT_671379 [Crassisporium funariophilum]